MPVFFILSGIVSAYSYEKYEFKEFIARRAKALMVPYLFFAAMLLAYKLFRDLHNGIEVENVESIVLNTIFITRKSYISGLWFLPCMLMAQCMLYFIMKNKQSVVRLCLCCLFSGTTLIFKNIYDIALPLNLDNALFVLPFLGIGIEIKKLSDRFDDSELNSNFLLWHKKKLLIGACLACFIGGNILSLYLGDSIIYYADIMLDNILLMVLTGLSGSLLVIFVARNISGIVENVLAYCGKNSLTIYGTHYAVLGVLFQILKKIWCPDCRVEYIVFTVTETVIIVLLILFCKYIFQRFIFCSKMFMNNKNSMSVK